MVYHIGYEVTASVALLFLYFFVWKIADNKSESTNRFRSMVFWAFCASVLDVITAITISYGNAVPVWLNILLNNVYYYSVAVLAYRLIYYVSFYAFYVEQRKKITSPFRVMLVVYALVIVANAFLGFIADFDVSGEYVHGPAYFSITLVPLFFVVAATLMVFFAKKEMTKRQKTAMICFFFIDAAGGLVQIFLVPDVLLSMFAIMVGVFFIFFLLETPDYHRLTKVMEELERTKAEAEKANIAKTEFLYKISHEIKAPISIIMGYNEMVMNETREDKAASYAANIQAAGRTISTLINDILDFIRLDEGNMKLEEAPYSVEGMFQDMVNYSRYNTEKKNLDLRISIEETIPKKLIGDETRIGQVLNNLISNAVKYTGAGYVQLTIGWEPLESDRGVLKVAVQDSGPGISEEDIKKIKQSEYFMGSRQENPSQGLGLGLTMVSKLLYYMGSELVVESHREKGSCFSFEITQQIADKTPIGNVSWGGENDGEPFVEQNAAFVAPRAKVLVVDDNMMSQELVKAILKTTRVQVDTALNGKEAIQALKRRKYNIVLMDIAMPVLDGAEAMKRIREENLCNDTSVIAFTAQSVLGEREQYLAMGFEDVIEKPVLGSQLLQMIKDYLPDEVFTDEREVLIKRLCSKLGFLDVRTALKYCDNREDLFMDMLRVYLQNDRRKELQENYEREDWDAYTALVRELKSTSLSIGANGLSDKARKTERFANSREIDDVRVHHEELVRLWSELLEKIQKSNVTTEFKLSEEKAEQSVHREHILVVDDDEMNCRIAEKLLSKLYRISTLSSGEKVVDFLEKQPVDLVLLDVHMPGKNGIETMEEMRKAGYDKIPVVFLTADNDGSMEAQGLQKGALDYITKPFVADIMIQRIHRILELSKLQRNMEKEVQKKTDNALMRQKKVERLSVQTMETLANAIDAKDKFTNGHAIRVAKYAKMIARRMGKSEREQEDIYYSALLHDIGKIAIPDEIINKVLPLTAEEYEIVKTHPVVGAEILSNISEMPGIETGARWHHERYDGTGYPDGLKGTEIPENARIIGVADAYDAMTSNRSYRRIMDPKVVRREMEKGLGTQFDPVIGNIFIQMMDEDKDHRMIGV